MLLEQENLHLEPLFLDPKQRARLRDDVLKTAFRFPKLFNRPLYRSFEQMVVNSPADFLSTRTSPHVRMILCVQFFLHKRIEAAFKKEAPNQKHLFLKLFKVPSRICVSLVFSSSYTFQKEQLLRALDTLLPGISEIPKSSYVWHSAEHPYYFCYFEVDKLRGKELSSSQLRALEKTLKDQMLASSPLTPAVFWPYNKEESHRQLQLLIREMKSKQDLPHVSIHFQEQSPNSLEFLIHLVRPKALQPIALEKLPESLYFFRYSHHQLSTPFPIEAESFSIRMQSHLFDVRDTINLLYARRYLSKHLEAIIGPFRDYNGGLFEKQQDHFEVVRHELSAKIPSFDLFAEKVFYALHPFEKWFSLSMVEVADLFTIFSELIQDPVPCAAKSTQSGLFTVVKTIDRVDFLRLAQRSPDTKSLTAYAQLTIGNFHYECFSGQVTQQITEILHGPAKQENTLKLVFQEGSPPSLNPHFSSGDMRCRLLNKMLFEGLTRLNEQGLPELAGAKSVRVSENGLEYTFELRKSRWSNGEKVTAFDYVDSWKWALQDYVSHPELLFLIKNTRKFKEKKRLIEEVGIRAIDPETVQIELEEPDPHFLYKLAQPFFFPLFGSQREPKWFNGPYLVQESKKQGLKLSRNPYFWNPQKPAFEYIDIQWNDNVDSIFALYKKGKIDWIGDPVSVLSVEQIGELEKEQKLRRLPVPRRFSLHFNTTHPILSSVAIRQALNHAIDREAICRDLFPHSTPIDTQAFCPEKAKAYFQKGLQELGLTPETFPPLTFSFSNQTRRDLLAQFLQDSWGLVLGIRIHLDKQNWNAFRSQLEKRNFEICGTIQDTISEDCPSYLERLEGENSWNFSQWSHILFRQLIAQFKVEQDAERRLLILNQMKSLLANDVPFVPLFNYTHLYALSSRYDCQAFDLEGCVDFTLGKRK